jgi:hypothetical protein
VRVTDYDNPVAQYLDYGAMYDPDLKARK